MAYFEAHVFMTVCYFFRHEPTPPALSEPEFEEIFQRNKTVSSSAISRAVQDASAGLLILNAWIGDGERSGFVWYQQILFSNKNS